MTVPDAIEEREDGRRSRVRLLQLDYQSHRTRLGQAVEGVRVEPVVDLGAIDPDEDDRAARLDGDLGLGRERNVGHQAFVVSLGMVISQLLSDGVRERAQTFDPELVVDLYIRSFDPRAGDGSADDWIE